MSDAAFTGSIPEHYDTYMGPMLFEPFGRELASRFAGFEGDLLETAAGTGRVTRHLAAQAPAARIVATDLNPPMLEKAARVVSAPNVTWQAADAQALPFADAGFDVVVCQFGVMFFPDKAKGFAEARRVLRAGGRFVFGVWDRLEANTISAVVQQAVDAFFPDDPPRFLARTPFGYNDPAAIGAALMEAGFAGVSFETVTLPTPAAKAADAAAGLCLGSPLMAEVEARKPGAAQAVADAAAKALEAKFGTGPIVGQGQSLVVNATV